jgi:hypothetical protein
MSSLRSGMVTVTLMVGVGLAAAAHTSLGSRASIDDTDASLMDETTGSVGPRKHPELPLSDEQRGRIYDGVMLVPDAPVAHAPVAHAPPPAVADALPREVPLHDLPAGVTRDVPLVEGHKFVKFDDRILVVDSASRVVVAMIPRYKLLP